MIEPQQFGQQALQEYLLLDYVQRLETRKYGHRAVHIHLSRLKPFHRRDYHIRVATNTFESYVKLYVGRIFVLTNSDLIFDIELLATGDAAAPAEGGANGGEQQQWWGGNEQAVNVQ
mgnify:CR=1 FL=1